LPAALPEAGCARRRLYEPVFIFDREFIAIGRVAEVGAPLASPYMVIVGTVIMGPAARRFSESSYCDSPLCQTYTPPAVMDHNFNMVWIVKGHGRPVKNRHGSSAQKAAAVIVNLL
jgi:hypothetical protein